MTIDSEIRKTVTDTTPVYAAVGATDLAVEIVRDARDRVVASADIRVNALQGNAIKRVEKVAEQAQNLPSLALNQTLEAAGKAHATYAELAIRGEKLVKRLRNQKSTKDLFAQAGSKVSLGKGAVTTVRKAALDAERVAKSTLVTGRREAEVVVGAVAAYLPGVDASTTSTRPARKSGAAVRLSPPKRTAPVAKKRTPAKRAAKATVATKAATVTVASTTAAPVAAPVEAVKIVTPKVGD